VISAVSAGVEVSVESFFLPKHSMPDKQQFMFGYRIHITNRNDFSIQLLKRQWLITDSLSPPRQIDGEGVVGQMPIIVGGESYEYQSYCDLQSNLGWMEGSYLFKRDGDAPYFEVLIPRFELSIPFHLN
jgi:ApaG protein